MYCASTSVRIVVVLTIGIAVATIAACSSDDGKPSGGTSSGNVSSGGTDAAADAPSEGGGAKKKNAEVGCTKNEECESNVCFVGGTQSYCAIPCTAANQATVCVTPFTGSCNKQGFCKRD